MGISPQRFIKKCRIDKACIMLHHSQDSIEDVAHQCGFADRYHFSRVFKSLTNISQAKYRRDFLI
jgi:transcriptional regulator GlxA family with amidase domain